MREERGDSGASDVPMLQTYREVLAGHRVAAWTVVAVSAAAGCAEAVGLASLVPMLHSAVPARGGAGGALYVLVFFLCAMLAVALRLTADVLIVRLTCLVERQLRTELFDGLLRLDWRKFASLRRGDLVSAVMVEPTQVAVGARTFLTGSSGITVASILAVAAGLLGGMLTAGAVVFIALSVVFYRKAAGLAARCQGDFARENSDLSEDASTLLHGLKYFRSGGMSQWWGARLDERTERVRGFQFRSEAAQPVTRAFAETLGAVFLAGVLLFSLLSGHDFAAALMFVATFYRVVPKLQGAQDQLLYARARAAWWGRWCSRRAEIIAALDRRTGTRPVPDGIRSIELRDVTVQFPDRSAGALQQVSVRFDRGRTYAVIGETGGGKSTLIDVVTGLIRPEQGRVLVNDVLLDDCEIEQWQRRIAFVPQEPVVIHGTIRDNVVWPGEDDDVGAVEAAMDAAQLSPFIDTLPDGLRTSVGHHGTALSGGQRQRIGVARALYANRPVLVLDEATSALDPDTEERLLDEVLVKAADRITLFVTHRRETARRADEVIVLREGRVAVIGSPEEVLGGSRAGV
ncbi:ABC transporter ATP-binding protein [Streptomyces sp. NPDC051636]|uniref:ABC transporter ATP-binding protein n=1 Tax=Streptomyces sp. NPDC051636 TaxID=3365663 RepID=UPI0037B4A194